MRFVYLLVLLFLFGCAQQAIPFEVVDTENEPVVNDSIPIIEEPVLYNETDFITVTYQPMQCEETPWDVWYAKGYVQFVKAPTAEEIISVYYSNLNTSFESVQRIDFDGAVCEACSICPEAHSFELQANNVTFFVADGWTLK